MVEWLERQIEANNYNAIYERIIQDDSLQEYCQRVANAVYDAIDDPAGDCDFCLSIIQAMRFKRWQWSCQRTDILLLLPLHRQLNRLDVPVTERNQYYTSDDCVEAAITLGNVMRMRDLTGCMGRE